MEPRQPGEPTRCAPLGDLIHVVDAWSPGQRLPEEGAIFTACNVMEWVTDLANCFVEGPPTCLECLGEQHGR